MLFGFGLTQRATVAGIELDTDVATIVAYGLSCLVYLRTAHAPRRSSSGAKPSRSRREVRYELLLQVAGQQGADVLEVTRRDISGQIREYPGYMAASVLLKDEASRHETPAARYRGCSTT